MAERSREVQRFRWLDDLRNDDLRFGVRGLARNPGFTATAALVLSILDFDPTVFSDLGSLSVHKG